MSRFEKIFWSKKEVILGLKRFFRSKKSKKRIFRSKRVKKFREAEKFLGLPKKFGGFLKKGRQKNWVNMAKKGNFRHILEIYGLEQSFFRSKKSKNKFLGLIFYF